MLGRLAVRNVKRSAKDYVIYFITVVLAFSFLFAFNLLGSSSEVLELSDVMNNFAIVMHVVNIFILFVVCFLINYTIKFMFSKRSLEFGTYLLLGIKKKQISNLFTLENVLLGLLTLPLAIFIGYILSLLMSFIITGLFELESIVHITFSIEAVLLLFVYFAFIYVFVLFLARRRIRKVKIYDLLYLEKKNEEKQFRKNKVRNVSFFVSLGLGILAMALFFQEFHRPSVDPSMATVLFCIVLIIFSIYGVVITLADFLLKVVLKNKKLKYQKDYLFYHKNKTVRKELDKIDSCVEQMLYYARSGNPEKDYFIKEFVFSDLLHRVLLDYKPYLLEEDVHILVYDADTTVFSDEKWLHFILSQIVQNSLKYFDKKEKTLEFFCESKEHSVLVHIKDNGCGIQASDLPRVFEKGFTGSLRQKKHSTGMGLYLARELCLKLGLSIEIFSKEGEYTEVIITLPLNTHEFKRGS